MRKCYCDLCGREVPGEELRKCDWFIVGAKEEFCYTCARTIWNKGKKFIKCVTDEVKE